MEKQKLLRVAGTPKALQVATVLEIDALPPALLDRACRGEL